MYCCCLVLHEDPKEDTQGCLLDSFDQKRGFPGIVQDDLKVVPIRS